MEWLFFWQTRGAALGLRKLLTWTFTDQLLRLQYRVFHDILGVPQILAKPFGTVRKSADCVQSSAARGARNIKVSLNIFHNVAQLLM